jgi:hypothetical protein
MRFTHFVPAAILALAPATQALPKWLHLQGRQPAVGGDYSPPPPYGYSPPAGYGAPTYPVYSSILTSSYEAPTISSTVSSSSETSAVQSSSAFPSKFSHVYRYSLA